MAIDSFKIDCSSSAPNMGVKGCKINMKDIKKVIFSKRGTKLNALTDTINQAKIDELVRMGLIIVMPSDTFTPQPEAIVLETKPNGAKSKIRDGLFEFVLTYSNKGVCFGNKLALFESLDLDVWFVDSSGTLYLDKSGDDFSGFSTELIVRDTGDINDSSSVTTSYKLLVQLDTNGSQGFYSRVQPITGLPVDLNTLGGVNDVVLELTATAPTATSIELKAFIGCDGSTDVLGMEPYFRAVDTLGASVVGTANYASGTYTFTPGTALGSGNYIIELYDTPNTSDVVIDTEGAYYKSNELSVTIP